ncbi:MAG: VOC family protein [Bacteroidetes bacterium]|nr:VOC family protein [Bacteroidota bacterium]MDA1121843.1 VOC family protein [Bacteroidota bacterium]
MTKISSILIVAFITLMAFKSDDSLKMQDGRVPNTQMLHIGIVVKDIEAARDSWAQLLGLAKKPDITIAEGHEANPTQYRGAPTGAKAKLSFFQLENLRVELIEPIGDERSDWREFLEKTGGGVHHVAFEVKGMGETYVDSFKTNGYELAQHGGWETGEYGYFD